MTQSSAFADKAVAQILELSADSQIRRRTCTTIGSLAYRDCSAAIAAYGKVLEVFTTLREQELLPSNLDFFAALASWRDRRANF